MIKKLITRRLLIVAVLLFPILVNAQTGFVQRNPFPGGSRGNGVSFTLAGMCYTGLGSTSLNNGTYLSDLWQYDEANDTWTQMANFPGAPREYAIVFSTPTRGYVGGGKIQAAPYVTSDFWEYDYQLNTWTQIPNIPGGSIYGACGSLGFMQRFVFGGIDSANFVHSNTWQYDPTTTTWTAKTPYPGNGIARASIFLYNILVGGIDNSGNYITTTPQYNNFNNTWSPKAPFPGAPRVDAAVINRNGSAYVMTGSDAQGNLLADIWRYDLPSNSWVQYPSFPSTPRKGVIGMTPWADPPHGYLVGGFDANDSLDEVWLWDSLNVESHVTDHTSPGNLVKVYPTIANEIVIFKFSNPKQSHLVIIFDAQGRECYRTSSDASAVVVGVSNFSAGVYMYRVEENGLLSGGKFAVEK